MKADIVVNGGGEFGYAAKRVAAQAMRGEVAKETLNRIEPGSAGGSEVEMKALAFSDPAFHILMLVRGVVETLIRPLTRAISMNYAADTEMLENVCEDWDSPHMVGKANEEVKLSADTLAKYAGTYEVREGPAGTLGRSLTIGVANGRLYSGGCL